MNNILQYFNRLFSKKNLYGELSWERHPCLKFKNMPSAIYAIGDVHGELELLKKIEAKIIDDALSIDGDKWIILIGDLVDRGPQSAQVIDHMLTAPPAGFKRFCLMGNHEMFMMQAKKGELPGNTWLNYGGLETLASYFDGRLPRSLIEGKMKKHKFQEFMDTIIPQEHIDYISSLPLSISLPGYFFTHAGIRPGVELDEQKPMDLLMIREGFIDAKINCGSIIVHGHTIVEQTMFNGGKINLDTGAYATKVLSAVRIQENSDPIFLNTQTTKLSRNRIEYGK